MSAKDELCSASCIYRVIRDTMCPGNGWDPRDYDYVALRV